MERGRGDRSGEEKVERPDQLLLAYRTQDPAQGDLDEGHESDADRDELDVGDGAPAHLRNSGGIYQPADQREDYELKNQVEPISNEGHPVRDGNQEVASKEGAQFGDLLDNGGAVGVDHDAPVILTNASSTSEISSRQATTSTPPSTNAARAAPSEAPSLRLSR